MTPLYDVYRGTEFLMRASLRGLVLFAQLDGSACGRIVVEQKVQKRTEPTVVNSCSVPPQELSVSIARSSLSHEV